MEYRIIRSSRKTLSIQITPEGVVVRAPYRVTNEQIRAFVESRRGWIEKHLAAFRGGAGETVTPLSRAELEALAQEAVRVIPERVRHYAKAVGVTYGRITIRNQRTRWGSCSSAGNLNFNCLLMLAPPEVLDSVVVHELCHRKEMNHSERFYAEVLRVFPEYRKWNGWLKKNGPRLLMRMPRG